MVVKELVKRLTKRMIIESVGSHRSSWLTALVIIDDSPGVRYTCGPAGRVSALTCFHVVHCIIEY